MPRKQTVKIVENEEEKTNKNLIMLDSNSIQILDTWIKGVGLNLQTASLNQMNDYLLHIQKLNTSLTLGIHHLMNYSDKTTELNNLIEKQIIKIQADTQKGKNKKFNDLEELIDYMENQDQIKRLEKILPDNQDFAKVYLQGYTPNTDVKKHNLLGTIKILGQYNFKKQERESYEIKVMQNEPSTFWCSCIDHKLNSAKKNTVCKHIAFVVCKVIKVLELYFFDSKILSPEHLQLLLGKFSNKSEMWKNKDLVRDIKQLTINTFKDFPVPIDDVCTFCYDEMTNVDIPISVCCPACKHCYHSECMDIWLENYLRCSVCSSEIWKHYPGIKAGNIVDINNKL
jgi:hypothetical protein